MAEDFVPARKAHPGFAVPPGELNPLAERLATAGAPVRWDDALHGQRRFFTQDPWGNRIEVMALPLG